jgi:hypothetical protein
MSRHLPLAALATLVLLCSSLNAISQRRGVRRSVVTADTIPAATEKIIGKSSFSNILLEKRSGFNTKPDRLVDSAVTVVQEKIILAEKEVIISDTIIVHEGGDNDVAVSDEEVVKESTEAVDDNQLEAELEQATAKSSKTKAINKKGVTEAYPFLSADGLRLYFTSNREGDHGRLFLSSRSSSDAAFGTPHVLSANLPNPFYCGTLTADERTLYLAKDGDIYVSKRARMSDEFGPPVEVKGLVEGWKFAPGISPDGNELVVTTTLEGSPDEVNVLFRKNGMGQFQKVTVLVSPKGMNAGPAQFSKDGLTLYCSLEEENNKKEKLFLYHRSSLNDLFLDMEEMPAVLNIHSQCLQPTVNGDETQLAYVVSNGGWDQDDIVLVSMAGRKKDKLNGDLDVLQKINTSKTKIYPNPFQGNIVFELNETPAEGTRFVLYDISGHLVRQEQLTRARSEIQLNNVRGGSYIFHVLNREGKIISSGKLMKM